MARVNDLVCLAASSRGKLELNMTEEPGEEDQLFGRLAEEAVKTVFDQSLSPKQFRNVVEYFENGRSLEVGDLVPTGEFLECLDPISGFLSQIERIADDLEPELSSGPKASALLVRVAEYILESLHCHNRLNKKRRPQAALYGL